MQFNAFILFTRAAIFEFQRHTKFRTLTTQVILCLSTALKIKIPISCLYDLACMKYEGNTRKLWRAAISLQLFELSAFEFKLQNLPITDLRLFSWLRCASEEEKIHSRR